MVSKRNIENLIQEPEEAGESAPFAPERHDITFRDVSFSYVPGEPVLKRVSFTVPDGKLTAIVGDSGSGKSTILNLIAKFYERRVGPSLSGGDPSSMSSAERVLAQLSMVDQQVFLFDDTVRENIRHARPTVTDREVEAAAGTPDVTALWRNWKRAMTLGLEKTAACSPEESGSGFLSPGPF